MKRAIVGILVVCFLSVLSLRPAVSAEKELKAVSFLPKNHPYVAMAIEWVNRVNDACRGELKINFVGGPEVIPGLEQVEALRKGVVQVVFAVTAYYESAMPEGAAFSLSKLTPWDERKPGGFYDFFVERHKEKVNAMYLGQWMFMTPRSFYIWLKNPVSTLAEIKGKKLRTTALYDRFMNALGAVPVTVNVPEVYTALERGTVEGAGWPLAGVTQMGWSQVLRYVIDHPFYNMNSTILMNLDVWNGLSAATQKKIKELTAKFEPDMSAHFDQVNANEWKKLDEIGVKKIHFSPDEAKKYVDTAYEVEWKALEKKVPDLVEKLKKLTGT